ncbi:MAG: riboflavin synthase [Candidatus Omnitrophica bacterium]|nr:riboflavin synthase [Candidatus Omnitrophota bacterium]
MFTGIVEETGLVKRILRKANATLLEVSAFKVLAETKIGDSIAVNGVCLTVISFTDSSIAFEIMDNTLKVTNLGLLKPGQKVNLERSLKVGSRVSGHFVTGHIDCLGIIRKRYLRQASILFDIAVGPEFIRYCLPKGSIAVDGISLTLVKTISNLFTVGIIPHTLKNTTLSFKETSEKLNIEFDILAKRSAIL